MTSLLLPLLLSSSGPAEAPAPSQMSLGAAFVENRGQWDSRARYRAALPGQTIWITPSGAIVDHWTVDQEKRASAVSPTPVDVPTRLRGHAIGLEFVGGGSGTFEPSNPLGGKLNFFLGNDPSRWATKLERFGQVLQNEVYPGIDVQWSLGERGARFDFLVAPGADPSQVRLRIDGATLPGSDGATLSYGTSLGRRTLTNLYSYQVIDGRERAVASRFVKRDDATFGVELGAYDRSKQLVIDPLVSGTTMGGQSSDTLHETARSGDHVVVSGRTGAPGFPATLGAYDIDYNSGVDIFVARLTADLSTLVAGTFLGGSGYDSQDNESLGLVASHGRVVVSGVTESANFPTTSGAYDTSLSGFDGFVSALSDDLSSLSASTYLGGSGTDRVSALAVHPTGAIIAGLNARSTDMPTRNALQPTLGGGSDVGILTLNAQLTALLYGTFLGGSGDEYLREIIPLPNGQLAVLTQTFSTNYPLTSDALRTTAETREIGLSLISPSSPTLFYSTYLGGNGQDGVLAASLDPSGSRLFMGVWSTSTDIPTTPGAYRSTKTPDSNPDVVLMRFDLATRTIGAATYAGFYANAWAVGVSGGQPTLAGQTFGAAPATPGPTKTTLGGGFLIKLSDDGKRLIYGTNLDAEVASIETQGSRATVAGFTPLPAQSTTPGAWSRSPGAWVAHYHTGYYPSAISLIATGATKTTHYWTANSGAITGWRNSGTIPTGWVYGSHGDFNGDERDDLVVVRTSDNAMGAYLLSATGAVTGWQSLGRVPTGWKIVQTVDINADGETDIVMQRNSDKAKGAWLMKGPNITAWRTIGVAMDLLSAEDLDGDGRSDRLAVDGTANLVAYIERTWGHDLVYAQIPPGYVYVGTFQADADGQLELLLFDPSLRVLFTYDILDGTQRLTRLTTVASGYSPIGTARLY